MATISVEQFEGKVDSLYRLVIVAARRAEQLQKPDARALTENRSKKPTITALHEILEEKIIPRIQDEDEEGIEE